MGVVSAVCLVLSILLFRCRGAWFVSGLSWCALMASTVRNHADDVLGDVFAVSGEFSLVEDGYLCVLDG